MGKFISYKNDTHIELALMAVAASPTLEDAVLYLEQEHGLQATPTYLRSLAQKKPEQYEALRERIAPFKEKVLTHNLMDNALYASEVTRVAMEQLTEKLAQGRIDPQFLSRVARDIADVQAKSIEKKLTLESRPTVITENRNPEQIIAALERKGVMRPVKQVEITQGEAA